MRKKCVMNDCFTTVYSTYSIGNHSVYIATLGSEGPRPFPKIHLVSESVHMATGIIGHQSYL